MSQISVAVIGAGAAGLCAARHLSVAAASHDLRIKVFEQTDNIGGTWVYTDNVGTDTHGLPVHSLQKPYRFLELKKRRLFLIQNYI